LITKQYNSNCDSIQDLKRMDQLDLNHNVDKKQVTNCENDDEDDVPRLSAETLAALQEFYSEAEKQQQQQNDTTESSETIGENWVRN
jgi:hypothetical protein